MKTYKEVDGDKPLPVGTEIRIKPLPLDGETALRFLEQVREDLIANKPVAAFIKVEMILNRWPYTKR